MTKDEARDRYEILIQEAEDFEQDANKKYHDAQEVKATAMDEHGIKCDCWFERISCNGHG